MGLKFLWIGLTIIVALTPVLRLFGLTPNDVSVSVGAILMVIGAIMFVLDK